MCTSGSNSYCFAPQVTYVGPASQCGSTDYYGASDASGVPIAWSYGNGSTNCTQVTYPKPDTGTIPANTPCSLYFYDPNGDATATFSLWVGGSSGTLSRVLINENPTSGWIWVANFSDLSGFFEFGDSGPSYPAKIAWGSSAAHSLWAIC
jgi:hypothetical protein